MPAARLRDKERLKEIEENSGGKEIKSQFKVQKQSHLLL